MTTNQNSYYTGKRLWQPLYFDALLNKRLFICSQSWSDRKPINHNHTTLHWVGESWSGWNRAKSVESWNDRSDFACTLLNIYVNSCCIINLSSSAESFISSKLSLTMMKCWFEIMKCIFQFPENLGKILKTKIFSQTQTIDRFGMSYQISCLINLKHKTDQKLAFLYRAVRSFEMMTSKRCQVSYLQKQQSLERRCQRKHIRNNVYKTARQDEQARYVPSNDEAHALHHTCYKIHKLMNERTYLLLFHYSITHD